ncbi:FtsW/RodA/SpoVE family cell cycle protein [Paenibacillus sp. y28]|uniref:FtsW/RodA/SpoVE family cell cycle protein n=1 Tax=Paenibacillus sp. y28 TaxID=3129110 RepID=UPI003015C247
MWDKLKKIDVPVIGLLLIFMAVSTVVIYSATFTAGPNYQDYYLRNLFYYGIGFVVLVAVMLFDYRVLLKISPYLYGLGILLLIAVYFLGEKTNGARSWFYIPGINMTFQPAELMKVMVIIAVAAFLGRNKGENLAFFTGLVPVGLIVLVPFTLVVIQPDLGNAIIFLIILVVMYWIGNIKYTHALIGLAASVAGIALIFYLFQQFHDPIEQFMIDHDKKHWVERIDTYLDPNAENANNWQVGNSIRAIGSGGLTGESFLNGDSLQKGFIPYAYSDSIFVVVGEEFGFIGSSLLLMLYFLLIYRMILIAMQSSDKRGSYIIVGIVSMLVFQIFENVGMMMGLMPLTGITLPFISYGGTSLLTNMISIGIILSVRAHQEMPNPYGAAE